MTYNSFITTIAFTTLLFSCKKENAPQLPNPGLPKPGLTYIDLSNKEIKQNVPGIFIDLNKDGIKDVGFGTQLVGDPVYQQDKLQFLTFCDIETNLPVNTGEEVPVLCKEDIIPLNNFNGHSWYNASSVVLVQKITGTSGPAFWQGNWKGAIKQYLPVQVIKNQQKFNGWVELTVDTIREKIILHRAAISTIGEIEIMAG